MVDEHVPHGPRRDAQEVAAVTPIRLGADQPDPSLVDQRGRLERGGARAVEVVLGDPVELVVDEGHQLVRRVWVPDAEPLQEPGRTILGISPGTVRIHRRNIYAKLRINSQGELFSKFIEKAL